MICENEHEDDAFGEFKHINVLREDSSIDTGASKSAGEKIDAPTGTFVAPPSLDEAQSALETLKLILHPP